jgi:histidyl-tRNA synthetase
MPHILRHISVSTDSNNNVIARVEDYRVFDCIADFLAKSLATSTHILYFPNIHSVSEIEKHLSELKKYEIKTIYRLNH